VRLRQEECKLGAKWGWEDVGFAGAVAVEGKLFAHLRGIGGKALTATELTTEAQRDTGDKKLRPEASKPKAAGVACLMVARR